MNLRNQAGLTLIEVAIVIAVIGILLIPTLSVYDIYRIDQIKRESDDRLNTLENALQRYAIRNGHYPIPANRNIPPDDINFGRVAVTAGMPECTPNIGVACRITNTTALYSRSPTAPQIIDPTCTPSECFLMDNRWGNILVGDVPIAELGMPINFIADGYGGKFTYVVTESQTDPSNFRTGPSGAYNPSHFEDSGHIRIIRVDGIDVERTNGDVHFAVFSHGEDQRGTFTVAGNLIRGCGTAADGRGFINCSLNDRVFTDNTGEIGVPPNVITTSYQVKNPGEQYFDDYVGYANSVTSEIWTRVISTVSADADIFSRSLGNVRLGANAALDNPPHPMAKVEVHGNLRIDGEDLDGDGIPDTMPRILAGRLCGPKRDVIGTDQPLLTTDTRFDEYGYDLLNPGSERFVVAHVTNQIFWPRRNSDGTLILPPQIDPARPIFVDDECPLPSDVTGLLTNPWPAGVFTPEVLLGIPTVDDAATGVPGGGILCINGNGMKGWRNVDEKCEEIIYNGTDIENACEETAGEYSSGIRYNASGRPEFTCYTN